MCVHGIPPVQSVHRSVYWPCVQMLSPTYKSRSEDFHKTFKEIPRDERLIVGETCTHVLVHLSDTDSW